MDEKISTTATSPSQSPATALDPPPSNEAVHREGAGGALVEQNFMGVILPSGSGGSRPSRSENVAEVIKKRGRPRKYYSETNGVSLASPPPQPSHLAISASSSFVGSYEKRGRGRPRGSGKLQLLASLGGFAAETAGGSFTPHVTTVHTGEDIVSKILLFSQKGPRAVCVLSAIGSVSSVTLRQPSISGGILRYEGRFEILSLSGSFTFADTGGGVRKNGVLSVSLAKPDGRVFGGGVAGSLIAAGPIQLIVASFKQSIAKELQMRQSAESFGPACASTAVHVVGHSNGEENCNTPTSAVSEPQNADATDNMLNVNRSPQNGGHNNVLQSSQMQSFSSKEGMT